MASPARCLGAAAGAGAGATAGLATAHGLVGSVNAVHGLPHTVGDDAGSGTDKHGDAAHDGGLHSERRSGGLRITSQLDVSTQ